MSFKEVMALRKAGKLDEALALAEKGRVLAPDDRWSKLAAAWVYYDWLKYYTEKEAFGEGLQQLHNIQALHLPPEERMVYDQCAAQIGRMAVALQKKEPIDYATIDKLFAILRTFHLTRPSDTYSYLYRSFHKLAAQWDAYPAFADWWGFDHLQPKDYQPGEFKGKKTMALAEQAYLAYAKKLLAQTQGLQPPANAEKIRDFLIKLEHLIQSYPAYQYPVYFKVKLLLALGETAHLVKVFLPFARQKKNDFWVWQLLAEVFAAEPEHQMACYCQALSLKTSEDFLGKLRWSFAALLLSRHMYAEAKTEIECLLRHYEKKGWKVPSAVMTWKNQDWYRHTTALPANKALYARYTPLAGDILYQDIPEEIIAVSFVNSTKKMLNFVKDKNKSGFFNYSSLPADPRIGDILAVRFDGSGKDGFFKMLTGRLLTTHHNCKAIKVFEAPLTLIQPHNFGFAGDVFVAPQLVQKYQLVHGQILSGKALLSFDARKKTWGWKAIL